MIISMVNNKGGVSKTFSTMQLGTILNEMGYRVLLIDLDPQGNLSNNFGIKDLDKPSIADVLLGRCDILDAKQETYRKNLDIITSNLLLMEAEDVIKFDNRRNDNRLQKVIKPIVLQNIYDFIIIDNSPFASTLLVNSLTASDKVLIPVEADKNSLEGWGLISKKINHVKEDSNPNLEILGIFITKTEHTNLHKEYIEEVKGAFDGLVFDTCIPKSVVAPESVFTNKGLIDYNKDHKLTKAYIELTKEILDRL